MLSNPLQRYSPYQNINGSAAVSNNHGAQSHIPNPNLGVLGQGPHFSTQHMHHANPSVPIGRITTPSKSRQHSNGSRVSGASGPIRRRISRACDQCNQLRTKCDGQHPCAHCIEFGLGCEYIRERKKRGKASKKDLAQQAAAQAAANGQKSDGSNEDGGQVNQPSESISSKTSVHHPSIDSSISTHDMSNESHSDSLLSPNRAGDRLDTIPETTDPSHLGGHPGIDAQLDHSANLDLSGYGSVPQGYDRHSLGGAAMGQPSYGPGGHGPLGGYHDLSYAMQATSPPNFGNGGPFRMGNSPLGYTMGGGTSPGWGMSMPSPTSQFPAHLAQPSVNHMNSLRYPVLEPILPHVGNILPISLACDLIDLYFASSSSAQVHPMSPYVLGFILRKRSFVHPTKPRHCQPALLASMLWVAAQTSDSPFLTSSPSARAKTCQKLLELTVSLLKPLIHTSAGDVSTGSSPAAADGVALGGLGVAMPGTISMDALTGESGPFGAAGNVDDVITYIHLAIVVSASEYKGASLRWWNAAWSLARELKLGRELPLSPPPVTSEMIIENEGDDEHDLHRNIAGYVTEEEREERRRIWWLAYIVDRHLALCYNRPLFLLDIECEGLLAPMDDTAWQAGEFSAYRNYDADSGMLDSLADGTHDPTRPRGPQFECRGHGIFGFFLPLMTILGETVDLHHAKNHPRFGVAFRPSREWDDQTTEISRHLEIYERSLKAFQLNNLSKRSEDKNEQGQGDSEQQSTGGELSTPSVQSALTGGSNRMTESDIQTRIVIAYGTHVMHVLHILLTGKWDPINLLDDDDLWISSDTFITATGHAVAAAEAISQILEFDPGLEFMPFFFGIYLLQGSFLLLLMADKLQSEASPAVVKACETIVRAHEACVVTLNTEYQRNFSKVMRSALAQVRGRVPEDIGERHQRRRELLSLYRWIGDGTGLAL